MISATKNLILENPTSDIDNSQQTLDLIEKITLQQIKDRTEELGKIFSKCEELYLAGDLINTQHILGFLLFQVSKFGISSLQNQVKIFDRKVSRSLHILEELSKLGLESPSELPPMIIQIRYAKLETLWEECQNEESRKDSIHPDIVARIENAQKSLDVYMSKYGISKIDPADKKYQKMWSTTKTSLDLKSKEIRFNHHISTAQKIESLPLAKIELERAYKMIQEHPSHFALEKQRNLIDMIAEIDNQLQNVEEDSKSFLNSTYQLLREFQFKKARQKLDDYKIDLERKGFFDHDSKIKELLEKCTANEFLFENLLEVEKIFEQNDLLGAKAEILKLIEIMQDMDKAELLIDTLKARILSLQQKMNKNASTGNISSKPFDPFDELEPIKSAIPEEKAEKTQIHSKTSSKQISKKIASKTENSEQVKKEKDALDALDDLFDQDL
ncbi:hypothetical protein [Candidatus Lokiarchaeum ossiferum]|uniref:hypothetical protein n=1 Tax=Candidatus Lokiarchaeum ossiferum TaxID=2951803 RepID=UPI00352F1BF3